MNFCSRSGLTRPQSELTRAKGLTTHPAGAPVTFRLPTTAS